MGTARAFPTAVVVVRLADAVSTFLGTISVANTRRGYAVPLDRMVRDFGADTNTATLDPDRVAGWFAFVWGGCSAKTFNTRLTALGSACAYWRAQEWLTGDPLVWLRTRADAAGPREGVEHRAGRDDPRVGRGVAGAGAVVAAA